MTDTVISFLTRTAEEGLGLLLYLAVIAILFPITSVIVGLSSWEWWSFRAFLAVAVSIGLYRYWNYIPWDAVPWGQIPRPAYAVGVLLGLVLITGLFPVATVNILGLALGLLISAGAILVLSLYAFLGTLIYGGTIAIGPGETIEGAEKRAQKFFRGVVGIAAWEWWIAWYLAALGGQIDFTIGLILFLTGGVIALSLVAWPEIGVKGAKYIVFYSALIGFSVGTAILLHNTFVAAGFFPSLATVLKTSQNQYWFAVTVIVLAVIGFTFLMEGVFGLIRHGVYRVAAVVAIAALLYWWQSLLPTIGIPFTAPSLPSSENWRLFLRGALLIGVGLWWLLAFWQRGLKGFGRVFAGSVPLILLAAFAEWVIWENGGFTTLGRGLEAAWRR